MTNAPKTIYAIWFAKGGHFEGGGTWEHPYGTYTTDDREVAEYKLNKLNANDWHRKFMPQLVEYTLKEDK